MILPEHVTLFQHQVDTAQFLIGRKRAFVHNDIGTGKTLAAATALVNVIGDRKALIVAPKSTLNHTWERTFYFHFPSIVSRAVVGTRSRRHAILDDDDVQVYIVNPDALHIIERHPRMAEFAAIVVDEHTYFKTATTRRYKALARIVALAGDPYLWLMSGSPMPQAPTDMFAPMKLVCPERLPKRSFTGFRDWSMVQVSQFRWVPRRGIEQAIGELLDGLSIRYSRDECVDIPPALFADAPVDPTTEQKKLEAELERFALAMVGSGESIDAVNEAALISKILQCAAGAVRYKDSTGADCVHLVNCDNRKDALCDIVGAADGPVIVFSPYRAPMDVIQEALSGAGYTSHIVHGGVSLRQREQIFDDLQARKIDALVAQPSAMSHGLTLTASNVVVWWGLPWSNETYEQATGRIIRVSQKRKQYIIHLTSSRYETEVRKRLTEKQRLQGTLLKLLQERR